MSSRRALVLLLLAVVIVAAGIAAWRVLDRAPEPATPSPSAGASPPPAAEPAAPEAPPPAERPGAPEPSPELPLGLGAVDLEEVRAALPDNLYWQTAAPSDDPAVLEAREREKAFRNEQYGKILSGTGTDAEILDYYDYRMRASTDYVQFADYLLEHYGSDLTDQDQTLLHVAKRLHLARLEEIPRRMQEARERKAAQDEARRAWLEEERAFRGGTDGEPESD
jgi:hypothetical protein